MKYIVIGIISLFLGTSLQAQQDQVSVTVEGLGCPFCAFGLEKKFKEVKDINNIEIDMETGLMTFEIPAEAAMTMEQIDARVGDAGYTAVEVAIDRADGTKEHVDFRNTASIDTNKEGTIGVQGNCGMCKARIEKAAKKIDGVGFAEWDKKKKMLTVRYDGNQTSIDDIEQAVAGVGHDTDGHRAQDAVYEDLPACCLYDREQ